MTTNTPAKPKWFFSILAQRTMVLFYPGPTHDWPAKRPTDVLDAIRTGNGYHPTEKPVDLMEQLCSFTRGVIFDPFMGSGTTGVAAAKMNRPFVGIEIHEPYFDIACRRIAEAAKQPDLFYNPIDDFAKSIDVAYDAIRERVAAGGPGWREDSE